MCQPYVNNLGIIIIIIIIKAHVRRTAEQQGVGIFSKAVGKQAKVLLGTE